MFTNAHVKRDARVCLVRLTKYTTLLRRIYSSATVCQYLHTHTRTHTLPSHTCEAQSRWSKTITELECACKPVNISPFLKHLDWTGALFE